MPATVIADVEVRDASSSEEYRARATIAPHAGRYRVRGGATETEESEWSPRGLLGV